VTLTASDIEALDFAKQGGLLPAVVQDHRTGAVLMLGYMNRSALDATLERGRVVFWSRSKGRLWEKGETSGNFLGLIDVVADCDRDALLVLAEPRGPACHLGTRTCFGDAPRSRVEDLAFLGELERVIERRIVESPGGSYTARLFAEGPRRIAQKVGEEGVEVALAGVSAPDAEVTSESADLLFHLLLLLRSRGLTLRGVVAELESRHDARKSQTGGRTGS
jgi:phosphoribosyl-ATP pyrophosphohydrolase/phosphoribosyl-AMP cyclohydrolase